MDRIVYELIMDKICESEWKRELFRRGSEMLENFMVRNVTQEEGWIEIRKKLEAIIEELNKEIAIEEEKSTVYF